MERVRLCNFVDLNRLPDSHISFTYDERSEAINGNSDDGGGVVSINGDDDLGTVGRPDAVAQRVLIKEREKLIDKVPGGFKGGDFPLAAAFYIYDA